MPNTNVRVRLAPSPTGEVHIGTIWLAQFNWLYAKQHQGAFVVRLEDTDQKRLVSGSFDRLLEALRWYGITIDEGPEQGGPHGPYVQSKRLDIYREHAEKLVRQHRAYYCFCTPERLEKLREEQQVKKLPPRYDKRCATLSDDEVAERRKRGEASVIRLNVPATGSCTLHDIIRGDVTFQYSQVDDSVLLKSDGFPTYHLAVVVDDHLMEITHVLRGEEWLSSVPKHLLLYEAFGWTAPQFAHLPLILGTDKAKLSKRHGSASALSFRDQGYLPEAMQNFLALMGWHPKQDKETLTRDEILKQFRLEEMNPSGAVFDQQKLDWLNGWYIRQLPIDQLHQRLESFWQRPPREKKWEEQALRLIQDRLVTLSDVNAAINFVYPDHWDAEYKSFDAQQLIPKKGDWEATQANVLWAVDWLKQTKDWDTETLRTTMLEAIKRAHKTNLAILWPVRVALSLRVASPDVFDLLGLLGREESLRRLQKFVS